jgi:hypothetical protein
MPQVGMLGCAMAVATLGLGRVTHSSAMAGTVACGAAERGGWTESELLSYNTVFEWNSRQIPWLGMGAPHARCSSCAVPASSNVGNDIQLFVEMQRSIDTLLQESNIPYKCT